MRKVIHICDLCQSIDTRDEKLQPLKYVHPINGLVIVKACSGCHDAVADTINDIIIEAEEQARQE